MARGGKRPAVNGKTTGNKVAKTDTQMKAKLALETAERKRQEVLKKLDEKVAKLSKR